MKEPLIVLFSVPASRVFNGTIRLSMSRESPQSSCSTALELAGAVPFVRQEALEDNPQQGPETPFLSVCRLQIFLCQQPREELLRQVLSVVRRVPLRPDKRVGGIPANRAKRFQRRRRIR